MKASGRKNFGNRPPPLEPELMVLMQMVERKEYVTLEGAARRYLGKHPGQPLAEKALSFALINLHRYEEALPLLRHAVKRNPHDPELQNNLGIALNRLMYWEESLEAFQKAMQGLPKDAEIVMHMGLALFRMTRWNDAVPFLLQAIEFYDGDYVEAIDLLASCLMNSNRIDEAWTCLNELHQADPSNISHLAPLISASLRRCHWERLSDIIGSMRVESGNYSTGQQQPFAFSSVPGVSRSEMLSISDRFARSSIPAFVLDEQGSLPYVSDASRRIRVGYLSGDYLRHPVGFIIPEVIERHDRGHFEIHAYSTRKAAENDPIRPRLLNAFDHFHEIGELPIRELKDRVRADDIDILVDLSGWTAYGRPEALALRCAPVQVNWLGYPGTIGHPALADYVLGDPIVTPIEHAATYAELIAQLPHCYLPADTTRTPSAQPTRADAGLPEGRFVFCSLNNSYKFNPAVFDLWCSILKETDDSVLWLSFGNDTVADHLRAEAEKRGIGPERLFFAKHVPSNEDHLARLGIADLALDTFPYNSHSTGIDTLWAGVPMVTLLGELFASRVGASAVTAAGLPELVTRSVEEYKALAIDLYRDRARLQDLRARLGRSPGSSPLFDMPAFTAALESMYRRMLENAERGVREALPA